MKKLLMIIPTLALTVSASSYAVSCGKPLTDKAQLKNSYTYGDSELNNVIDKSLIRDLKASSILAKIFIAGRHENANYAAPSVLNNLVTMTTNPVLKLKNGDYNIEKELNRIKTYNDALGYGSPVSGYAQTATSVFYMDKNYHKKNSDYDINNVAWAHYDTGPMVNSIIKNFPEIKEIITANGFSDDFFGAINTHNTLFKKNKYNEKTKTFNIYSDFDFGKETADLNWAVYNKWSNAIISLFNAGISFFGRGTENLGLLAFGLIFPFVEQHSNSNSNFSNLIPFIWSVGKTMVNWFEKENLGKLTLLKDNYKVSIKKDSVLDKLKINIPPENQNEFDNVIEKLYDSLNRMINAYSYTEFIGNKIFSSSNKDKSFSLDGKSENINNLILEIVKSADYFGKMVDLTTNFDTKEYDILAGKDFAKAISEQMGVFSSFLWPQTEAFLAIIDKIIQNGAFPIKEFGAGTSELFSIFTEKNTDGDIVLNYDMFNKIKEIVNYQKNHPNDKSFTKSLTEIDMTGKYYKKILKNYGLDEKTDMYKDGSLFNIFYKWSHDPNSSMYKAFKKLFNTKGNFLSDLIMESERIINEKSFELLFRDDFWNIKAMGEGVDGSKLGWNKDKTELKYQLDYFGPKDASVDLNLHQEKLLYYDTDENTHKDDGFESFGEDDGFESFGEDDSFSDPFFQSEPTKNMKDIPKILKNMSETSLMKYDGKANEYLKESKDIKYSYVVTFTNLNGKTKTKEQNWKFIDFKWFYNNKRYY